MTTDKTLAEIRRIKEKCSLARLSRTPEEQKLESERLKEWFENWIGRPIETVDNSKHSKVIKEELAQV
ncbi:MAG: hypothetical protein LBB40_02630 [Holophagales bacterium]|jgi:hypothetical protein|nr:hypothetical protein [Holophagales bacterium]